MNNLIIQRLKSRMELAHLTPTDLERRAGLSLSSVRNILNGRSKNPTIETMLAIANTLGCTVDDLVNEKTPSIPEPEKIDKENPHPWVRSLVLETIDFVEHYLKSKSHTASFEQSMFFVKEIYTFSVETEKKHLDKRFGEWLINKNLSKLTTQKI